MKCTRTMCFVALAIFAALPIAAQTSEGELAARLVHKPLYFRGFYRNDKLKFDPVGGLLGKSATGSFTVAGMEVEKVTLRSDRLEVEGSRAALRFTDGVAERVLLPDHPGSPARKVHVEIEAPADHDYRRALDAIFAAGVDELVPSLPDYWQPYATSHLVHTKAREDYVPERVETPNPVQGEKAKSEQKAGVPPTGVMRVGGGVKAPRPLKMADPKFTQEARQAGVSGAVLVGLWVDETGHTTHLRVLKPCGLGLDEAAVEAVRRYLLQPATVNGVPVTVEMNVEVNFQIF